MRGSTLFAALPLLFACAGGGRPPDHPVAQPALSAVATATCVEAGVAKAARAPAQTGSLVLDGVPEIPQAITEQVRRYTEARRADLLGWDARGSGLYVATRFGSTTQVHRVERPMGARTQLTFFSEPVTDARPALDPKNPGIMLTVDQGGNEFTQIYWQDATRRELGLLTDGKSRNEALRFSPDGRWLAYSSTERNGRDFDVWVLDAQHPEHPRRLVYQAEGLWAPLDWSPSGDRLLVRHDISATKATLHVLDLAGALSAPIQPAAPPGAEVYVGAAVFSANAAEIFYVSDAGGEFRRLYRRDLASGRDVLLTPELSWDIESIVADQQRRALAVVLNEGGFSRLRLLDLATSRFRPDPRLPQGVFGRVAFSPDGRELGFTAESGLLPGDVFSLNLKRGKVVRWTESEIGAMDPRKLHQAQPFVYPSFDAVPGPDDRPKARPIPALMTLPDGPGPHPVVINIHGGPEAQWRPWFWPFGELLVSELKVAVISPNVRGSTGYGRTYTLLDNAEKREDSVKDIGALLDWIATQPNLDKKRVALYGGSYGGFMVLASGAAYAERVAAVVDVVGISNFVTFLEGTQPYRRDLRRVEYGDERDPDMRAFLERISPTKNAERIRAPLLVAQGANDPRVPRAEAEQIVRAVRGQGRDVWYFLAMDEGHGFKKLANRERFSATMVHFLRERLLGR